MKLYRGDSIPKHVQDVVRDDRGRTFADHFCGTGLMAKFADGGSSKLLRGKELIHMILSHVGYERGQPEQEFSYRSHFFPLLRILRLRLLIALEKRILRSAPSIKLHTLSGSSI
jgi:hypothetical protein